MCICEVYGCMDIFQNTEEHYLQKETSEFFAKRDVDEEVDGRVNCDEKVADVDELVVHQSVEWFEYVVDEGEQIAQEENDDYAEEHRRQTDLFLLQSRQSCSLLICQPNLKIKKK